MTSRHTHPAAATLCRSFPLPQLLGSVSQDSEHLFNQGHVQRSEFFKRPPDFANVVPGNGNPERWILKDQIHSLRRVVNSNWDLFQDRETNLYYLRYEKSWLAAPEL